MVTRSVQCWLPGTGLAPADCPTELASAVTVESTHSNRHPRNLHVHEMLNLQWIVA